VRVVYSSGALLNQVLTSSLRVGHPVNKFVPSDVPVEKLCLLGAATDMYVQRISCRVSSDVGF